MLEYQYMNIVFKGQYFFEIQAEGAKIVIDPEDIKKVEADLLLLTHVSKSVSCKPFLIDGLGEYEVKDVFVKGIRAFCDKEVITIYKIEVEDVKLCHLSCLKQKELTEEQMEEIGEVDVLMIPVGGGDALDAKLAKGIISQIEPRIVIPMQYKSKNEKDLDDIDRFLKQMGTEKVETEKKFKVSVKTLPTEETKIVVLES